MTFKQKWRHFLFQLNRTKYHWTKSNNRTKRRATHIKCWEKISADEWNTKCEAKWCRAQFNWEWINVSNVLLIIIWKATYIVFQRWCALRILRKKFKWFNFDIAVAAANATVTVYALRVYRHWARFWSTTSRNIFIAEISSISKKKNYFNQHSFYPAFLYLLFLFSFNIIQHLYLAFKCLVNLNASFSLSIC